MTWFCAGLTGLAIICFAQLCGAAQAARPSGPPAAAPATPVKAFLDCQDCFADFLRDEVPWGTLEARTQWSQYLHDLEKSRFEIEADMSVRVTRGLSVGFELNASRIRDQLSLPARGASEEEVLLRQRQLRSGYEYEVGMSLTYSFGSIFSSIVNPRFGR